MIEPILEYYHFGPGVVAFSTTRQGGYSRGSYGEFNINRYCGDSEACIQQNREALCCLLRIADDRLLMPHQVHLTEIVTIDDALLQQPASVRRQSLEGKDAIMTDLPGVCIGVSTADCIPVLLYDPVHHACCAVHAGWRGTVARIVEQSVQAMEKTYSTCPQDLLAQIGPGISLDSFEVGDEVYDAFSQAGFEMSSISRRVGKWHIDLPMCNQQQLIASGIPESHISVSSVCTYQHDGRFFSARRLGINSGRIYTGILLR